MYHWFKLYILLWYLVAAYIEEGAAAVGDGDITGSDKHMGKGPPEILKDQTGKFNS